MDALADALDAAAAFPEVAPAEPPAEPIAEASRRPEAAGAQAQCGGGSAPMSRARRVKGEVMVFLLRIGAKHG